MIWNRSDVSRAVLPGSCSGSPTYSDPIYLRGRSAWTKADIRRARKTPLKPVLEKLGYRLEPTSNDNYLVTGIPQEIIVKDHYWICTDTGSAGNAIDFLVQFKNTSFNEAIRLLQCRIRRDTRGYYRLPRHRRGHNQCATL